MYKLKVPTEGFTTFELYRYAFSDDEVEIHINEGQYIVGRKECLDWLTEVMNQFPVEGRTVYPERVLDLIWNFRRIYYDLERHWFEIPKDQSNPFEEKVATAVPYRRGSKWIFGPHNGNPFVRR